MPSIRVAASFSERYNTTLSVTLEQSIIELPDEIDLRKSAPSAEIELARRLVKDQITAAEVELMRQFDVLRANARERERAEAEAEQARKDERAGQPDIAPTPADWVS